MLVSARANSLQEFSVFMRLYLILVTIVQQVHEI